MPPQNPVFNPVNPASAPSRTLPPLGSIPLIDTRTGIATPHFIQFLQRLWSIILGAGGLADRQILVDRGITEISTQIINQANASGEPLETALLAAMVDQQAMVIAELRVIEQLLVAGLNLPGDDVTALRDELFPSDLDVPAPG